MVTIDTVLSWPGERCGHPVTFHVEVCDQPSQAAAAGDELLHRWIDDGATVEVTVAEVPAASLSIARGSDRVVIGQPLSRLPDCLTRRGRRSPEWVGRGFWATIENLPRL